MAGERGMFDVHINTVVGAGTRRAEDALTIAQRARALGFSTSVGIIHDGTVSSSRSRPKSGRFTSRSRDWHARRVAVQEPVLRSREVRGQPGRGPPEHVAVPRGRPIPVHLRGRAGALLLAAARALRESRSSRTRATDIERGLPYAQGVRAVLHDRLRAPRVDHGLLARPADGANLGRESQRRDG